MKLQFKNQAFQEAATVAVCDVFEGQPYHDPNVYTVDPVQVVASSQLSGKSEGTDPSENLRGTKSEGTDPSEDGWVGTGPSEDGAIWREATRFWNCLCAGSGRAADG